MDIVTESNDALRTRILPSPLNENHLGPSSNAPSVNASDPREEQPIDQQGLLRLICEEVLSLKVIIVSSKYRVSQNKLLTLYCGNHNAQLNQQ